MYIQYMCMCESVYYYLILLCFVSERFQTVYTRRMHFSPTISSVLFIDCFHLHETIVFVPNVQFNIAKVLHFSASSFLHVQCMYNGFM